MNTKKLQGYAAGIVPIILLLSFNACTQPLLGAITGVESEKESPVSSALAREERPEAKISPAARSGMSPALPDSIRNNTALQNSPRIREEYTSLTRPELPPEKRESTQLMKILQNRALANSPRVREEFPALTRPEVVREPRKSTELMRIRQNRALVHSPRIREEFPELRFEN